MNQNRNLIVALVVILVLALLACCCIVAMAVTFWGGCAACGFGSMAAMITAPAPYGIDERPAVPAGLAPDSVFPPTIGDYTAGPVRTVSTLASVTVPRGARGVVYTGPAGRALAFAVQMDSQAEAQQFVELLQGRVKKGGTGSYQYRAWPGKPFYARWYVSGWGEYTHGIVWNNGRWVLGVTSASEEARDAVAGAFPY